MKIVKTFENLRNRAERWGAMKMAQIFELWKVRLNSQKIVFIKKKKTWGFFHKKSNKIETVAYNSNKKKMYN